MSVGVESVVVEALVLDWRLSTCGDMDVMVSIGPCDVWVRVSYSEEGVTCQATRWRDEDMSEGWRISPPPPPHVELAALDRASRPDLRTLWVELVAELWD